MLPNSSHTLKDLPCCNVLPIHSAGSSIWLPSPVCGIRSIFLNDIAAAFEATDKPKHLLMAPYFREEMKASLSGWKSLVAEAMKEELPVPAFSSALNYFYSLTSADLPANMVQAQRDYFGAHTFERVDGLRGQFFHENWTGHGGDTKSGTYNV